MLSVIDHLSGRRQCRVGPSFSIHRPRKRSDAPPPLPPPPPEEYKRRLSSVGTPTRQGGLVHTDSFAGRANTTAVTQGTNANPAITVPRPRKQLQIVFERRTTVGEQPLDVGLPPNLRDTAQGMLPDGQETIGHFVRDSEVQGLLFDCDGTLLTRCRSSFTRGTPFAPNLASR